MRSPRAGAARERFVVLETGFGLGNNFLATWAAWRADPERCRQLHFVSIEAVAADARRPSRRSTRDPSLAPLAAELARHWPPLTCNLHRIVLDDGGVELLLAFGAVDAWLPQLVADVDAFFLDGFAPARNPAMWDARLFKAMARLAAPGRDGRDLERGARGARRAAQRRLRGRQGARQRRQARHHARPLRAALHAAAVATARVDVGRGGVDQRWRQVRRASPRLAQTRRRPGSAGRHRRRRPRRLRPGAGARRARRSIARPRARRGDRRGRLGQCGRALPRRRPSRRRPARALPSRRCPRRRRCGPRGDRAARRARQRRRPAARRDRRASSAEMQAPHRRARAARRLRRGARSRRREPPRRRAAVDRPPGTSRAAAGSIRAASPGPGWPTPARAFELRLGCAGDVAARGSTPAGSFATPNGATIATAPVVVLCNGDGALRGRRRPGRSAASAARSARSPRPTSRRRTAPRLPIAGAGYVLPAIDGTRLVRRELGLGRRRPRAPPPRTSNGTSTAWRRCSAWPHRRRSTGSAAGSASAGRATIACRSSAPCRRASPSAWPRASSGRGRRASTSRASSRGRRGSSCVARSARAASRRRRSAPRCWPRRSPVRRCRPRPICSMRSTRRAS